MPGTRRSARSFGRMDADASRAGCAPPRGWSDRRLLGCTAASTRRRVVSTSSPRVLMRLATVATTRTPRMIVSDSQIGISGTPLDVLAAVDERQARWCARLHDQLDADERQDHRQPEGQVDQSLEQAAQQEVELAQAHQREDVRREDDERLLGEPEDRRDAVEREEQVRRPEGQEDDDHRRPELLAVLGDPDLAAVVVLGDRQDLPHPADERVLLVVFVLAPVPDEVDRRVHEERAEDVEDPGEPLDDGGAEQDEDAAQDQRDDDPHHQGFLLQLPGHLEARHDDHEDEEVVDRQRVLGQPARVELRARTARRSPPRITSRRAGRASRRS